MKKLILASAATLALATGFANAGIILQTDENDRKVWINTWAGQSADKTVDRRYGSSVSTFSGSSHGGLILSDDENDRKSVTNLWAGQRETHAGKRGGESVSTFSGRLSPGTSIRGKVKNTHEVWIGR